LVLGIRDPSLMPGAYLLFERMLRKRVHGRCINVCFTVHSLRMLFVLSGLSVMHPAFFTILRCSTDMYRCLWHAREEMACGDGRDVNTDATPAHS